MLDEVELLRQVIASASRAKLPRAEEAMDVLVGINAGMIELKAMKAEIIQAAIDEQEAEDIANGMIAHG